MAAGPGLPEVAGQHHRQVGGSVHLGRVEPVVDPLALVDGDRFDRGDVVGQPLDQILGRPRDLRHRVEIVVLQMFLIQRPERGALHGASVGQADREGPGEPGLEPVLPHRVAYFVSRDRTRRLVVLIPDHVVAELRVLFSGEPLNGHRRPVSGEGGLVAFEHLVGAEPLQRVGPDQQREIRELLDEVLVVLIPLDQEAGDPQKQRGIGLWTNGNPVVGLGGRRPVLRRNHHNLAAAFHAFDEPVGIGQLVLDQVLAIHDDELGEPEVVEVAVRRLQAVDPGMAGRLIAVPGVVGKVAAAFRLVRPDATDLGVE